MSGIMDRSGEAFWNLQVHIKSHQYTFKLETYHLTSKTQPNRVQFTKELKSCAVPVVKYCILLCRMRNWLIVDHELNGSKKKCFPLLKKANIIPEIKQMKSSSCSNRCRYVPKERFTYSFAHHAPGKVGTNRRERRGDHRNVI